MKLVYFITHPNVNVDLTIPVEKWDLSELGHRRLDKMLEQPWVKTIGEVYSSEETKAITSAQKLADFLGVKNTRVKELGEMDRSATGPLPPEEFNQVVDEFFTKTDQSIRGWERAIDVQHRIIKAVETIIYNSKTNKNIAIVSHGGVGTMYLCYLKKVPISREEDQPSQGHYFAFDAESKELVEGWKPIEA